MRANTIFTTFRILAAAALAWMPFAWANAAETCGCDVPAARVAAYDALLPAAGAAAGRHLPFGAPRRFAEKHDTFRADQPGFAVLYDLGLGMPVWVSYELTAEMVSARRPRTQCFRPDPRYRDPRLPGCADYRRSGFDRGHMAPSADMATDEPSMVNSYVFTNLAPQYPGFNRTIWAALERDVREMARRMGRIHVTTGAIFDRDGDGRPDPDGGALLAGPAGAEPRLRIATHFFKIVVAPDALGAPAVTAWLLEHRSDFVPEATRGPLIDAARVPLERIGRMAGFDFLPALDSPAEQAAR